MKYLKTFVFAFFMVLLLAGCQGADNQVQEQPEDQNQTQGTSPEEDQNTEDEDSDDGEVETANEDEQNKETQFIEAKAIELYPRSLFDQTEFDIDQDGEEEIIEMYVNADKDEEGTYMWDDGQDWLLVVKDGDKTYPLFEGWVQLGSLQFWLLEANEKPMLILLKTGTAEFHLQTFTYDKEKDGFVQESYFNPENVNFWFSSK
ncbi:hypothetical protein GCM10008967_20710 [Bacillus carboniphilus]|uniref:Lipoprotein n=1 Tax=Bacillus carboniphilus TaxID=86663 RepID=A0ABN0W9N6_9BACI